MASTDCMLMRQSATSGSTTAFAVARKIGPKRIRLQSSHFAPRATLKLTDSAGNLLSIDQEKLSIGSAASAGLRVTGQNVAAEHAEILQVKGKVTCTALVGDSEDLTSESFTWMNDTPLRTGVQYLLSPGARVAFGDTAQVYEVDFEEQQSNNALLEMMVQGMAAGASQEVKKELGL